MKNKNLFKQIVISVMIATILTVPAVRSQTTLIAPKQEKLLNGLKVLMWSDAKADKVAIKIRIHSGCAFDPQGKEGVMQILADNLFPSEASREFFTEDLGGDLEIVTSYDYIQINASSKPDGFLTMLETISSAVSNPTIDKETTVKLRNALMVKVAAMEADPVYLADRAVAKRLFGIFPYGRPQYGTADSLKTIDFADLIDARSRFMTADNATVTVSGNFDRALGFKAIRRYFGPWLKADKLVPSTFRQPDPPVAGMSILTSPVANKSEFRFSLRGIARNDKDFFANWVLANVLRSRFQAKEGRKASVKFEAHSLPGTFTFSVSDWNLGQIKREGDKLALPVTESYQSSFLKDAVTESEFNAAKNEFQMAFARIDTTDMWLDADTFKLGAVKADWDNAQNVGVADVQRSLERLRKEPAAFALVFAN